MQHVSVGLQHVAALAVSTQLRQLPGRAQVPPKCQVFLCVFTVFPHVVLGAWTGSGRCGHSPIHGFDLSLYVFGSTGWQGSAAFARCCVGAWASLKGSGLGKLQRRRRSREPKAGAGPPEVCTWVCSIWPWQCLASCASSRQGSGTLECQFLCFHSGSPYCSGSMDRLWGRAQVRSLAAVWVRGPACRAGVWCARTGNRKGKGTAQEKQGTGPWLGVCSMRPWQCLPRSLPGRAQVHSRAERSGSMSGGCPLLEVGGLDAWTGFWGREITKSWSSWPWGL